MQQKLRISKLDAAKRQLETVIRLYFSDADPVSLHTLTAAAYNLLRDLNAKRGGAPLILKDQSIEWVKNEYQRSMRQKINEAENFFKHADRDTDGAIEFNPEQTEILIWEACNTYYRLSGEFPALFKVHQIWFAAKHPTWFKLPAHYAHAVSSVYREVADMSRAEYFKAFLPLMSEISV